MWEVQETMEVHWGKHHRTYVDNLNKQLEGKPLADKPIEEVSTAHSPLSLHHSPWIGA